MKAHRYGAFSFGMWCARSVEFSLTFLCVPNVLQKTIFMFSKYYPNTINFNRVFFVCGVCRISRLPSQMCCNSSCCLSLCVSCCLVICRVIYSCRVQTHALPTFCNCIITPDRTIAGKCAYSAGNGDNIGTGALLR